MVTKNKIIASNKILCYKLLLMAAKLSLLKVHELKKKILENLSNSLSVEYLLAHGITILIIVYK